MNLRSTEVISFEELSVTTAETTIFVAKTGAGPALLLLHGFPQTHRMWRHLAPILGDHYTVVCADLRGYGESGCPSSTSDHLPYSKRAMASEMVAVMRELGYEKFTVVGHDRGARVAYRMALDFPKEISALAVLDIIPTAEQWNRMNKDFSLAFWPWILFAQPAPFPEKIIAATYQSIVDDALDNWGTPGDYFPNEIRQYYYDTLRRQSHAHAICEEYRAAATIDHEHDLDSIADGERIQCPVLALWSTYLDRILGGKEGILSIWKKWAFNVSGHHVVGGHFFPEERPMETVHALLSFFHNSLR